MNFEKGRHNPRLFCCINVEKFAKNTKSFSLIYRNHCHDAIVAVPITLLSQKLRLRRSQNYWKISARKEKKKKKKSGQVLD